jgi:hypothetical protein
VASLYDSLKLFAITAQLLEQDLDQVESQHGVDLRRGHRATLDSDDSYYRQIESAIRAEAAAMAPHYEVFYSLETTIRRLVADSLEGADGEHWWSGQRVPERLRDDAEERQERERDSGVTPRSEEPIAFTTFGELGQIIKINWDVFGAIFPSVRAIERVMANLNTLRGPIAHCAPLAEDEVVRLRLAVRDWFRLME